uniref:Uncharacterized protein n=1 Tax=Anguilla anguilla TaxID=7936 RepID=A0A0E9UE81_ANGAN
MYGVYQCRGFLLFIKGTYSLKKTGLASEISTGSPG